MRVVDVHLGHVRQKLGNPDLIATVRGAGYRFEDELL
jgi:two-component system alkaline phosphatase synthesis response regulator PhoP